MHSHIWLIFEWCETNMFTNLKYDYHSGISSQTWFVLSLFTSAKPVHIAVDMCTKVHSHCRENVCSLQYEHMKTEVCSYPWILLLYFKSMFTVESPNNRHTVVRPFVRCSREVAFRGSLGGCHLTLSCLSKLATQAMKWGLWQRLGLSYSNVDTYGILYLVHEIQHILPSPKIWVDNA